MSLSRLLLGRPLANQEAEENKIGVLEGLPAMGLDGLGSAAYGPEAALTVLLPLGALGLGAIGPITWVILVLLAVLFFSYWQTIEAYPSNGGSYTVAKENLGATASLLAASALMVDYMLNVAVGISAGIGALTSAVPVLQKYTLPLCLAVLALTTLVNMRGTRESGLLFAGPTYLFIAALGGILLYGAIQAWSAGGHPTPVIAPPAIPPGGEAIGLWLLLRAFAAGCTAMTGVEAVSNGVGAFKEPRTLHAHRTLAAIVVVLAALLLGIAYLAKVYGVMAMDQTHEGYQSVLSQLVSAVYGRGWLYYVIIGSVLAVLCLSANTSFVGFPRLCRQVAADGYLPKAFAVPGRRLVYTAGILFLAAGAGALLIVFGGITDRLIPLFAVGAFLSFTLSQAGMAIHWQRHHTSRTDRFRLGINGLGAIATATALVIILAAKFTEGAWLTIVVIPATLFAASRHPQLLRQAGQPAAARRQPPGRPQRPCGARDRHADRPVGRGQPQSARLRRAPLARRHGPALHRARGPRRRGARSLRPWPLGRPRRSPGPRKRRPRPGPARRHLAVPQRHRSRPPPHRDAPRKTPRPPRRRHAAATRRGRMVGNRFPHPSRTPPPHRTAARRRLRHRHHRRPLAALRLRAPAPAGRGRTHPARAKSQHAPQVTA